MVIEPVDPAGELVSVVVPAYNAEATVRETLQSALAQSHRNLEVIVVDDGSTDRTPAIVEDIAARDPRVRLLRQANAGAPAARNRGIGEARGELIAMLDADDLWHPTKITKQVALMRAAGPSLGLVYTWYREIDDAGRIIGSPEPCFEGDVYATLVLRNFVGNGSTALIRRACLLDVGGFDVRLRAAQDTKLFLDIAERYDFAVVPEFLAGYRDRAGSLSKDVGNLLQMQEFILAEARQRHPELPDRLFRWARGEFGGWLALRSFSLGRFWLGVYLLARTSLHDPAAVFRPSSVRAVLHGVRKALGLPPLYPMAQRKLAQLGLGGNRDALAALGQPFLAAAPEPATALTPGRGRFRGPRAARRRQAVAASWHVRRLPSESVSTCAPIRSTSPSQ